MKVLIAGGGTGGHLFPGIALAEEITTRQMGNEVIFVGTARGLEATVVPKLGFELRLIEVSGLKRQGLMRTIRGLLRLPVAFFQALKILRDFKPDVAIGVGGYASGPVILVAALIGLPTAVLEQNTVPGITNRILSRFVNRVFTTFGLSENFFPKRKVMELGNPIRRQLLENFLQSREPSASEGFNVLVLGGSQGAHAVNLRMIEAASHLGELEQNIRIVHQTGERDHELVTRGYADIGFDATAIAFIDDMSAAYRRADLIVARAGATTISEIQVAKKASVLIPFPYAADNHQELNAIAMVDAGASIMLVERNLDGPQLAETIRELYLDQEKLIAMETAAAKTGRPEAAREIVNACDELIKERERDR
jgi:UDP-N-acetylglucosamine--N-acetylmuramyl-(pentapeptide) pyrophosphoryl-undecaprenol N-acetylglucosamine transferase